MDSPTMSQGQFNQEDNADHVSRQLREIKEAVRRIEQAIGGDPGLGHMGLAERVKTLEAANKEHEKQLIKFGALVASAASIGTFVLSYFKDKIFGS